MANHSAINPEILAKLKNHSIVFYDGDCGFCQFWVQFILKRDSDQHFLFAPLQAKWIHHLHAGLVASSKLDTVYLYSEGKLFTKSAAALQIIQKLGGVYKIAMIIVVVPAFIRDFFYDLIAANRHRILKPNQCWLPQKDEQARFLND